MKCLAAVLFAMLSVNAHAVSAHEGVGCQSLNDNSCWHAMNGGSSPVDVRCSGYGRASLFAVSSLTDDQLYAYQFCQGWADGLGYFEPRTPIHCVISARDGRAASVDFFLQDYGDRVAIEADDDEVTVRVRSFWSNARQVERAPLL